MKRLEQKSTLLLGLFFSFPFVSKAFQYRVITVRRCTNTDKKEEGVSAYIVHHTTMNSKSFAKRKKCLSCFAVVSKNYYYLGIWKTFLYHTTFTKKFAMYSFIALKDSSV